jgi:hypothetical protein
MFRAFFFNPSSEAAVQLRQWFKSAVYGVTHTGQDGAELYGVTHRGQDRAELYGVTHTGQDRAELYGVTHTGQDRAELYAVYTPYSSALSWLDQNHFRIFTPPSEDGLKESPKHVRQK